MGSESWKHKTSQHKTSPQASRQKFLACLLQWCSTPRQRIPFLGYTNSLFKVLFPCKALKCPHIFPCTFIFASADFCAHAGHFAHILPQKLREIACLKRRKCYCLAEKPSITFHYVTYETGISGFQKQFQSDFQFHK